MSEQDKKRVHQQIDAEVKAAVAQALERHRKLGEPIAIWQKGKVFVVRADEIPQTLHDSQPKRGSHE